MKSTCIVGGCPRGVSVKSMGGGIVVGEFELQTCYCVHFWTNTVGKGMKPPYPPSYWLNSTTTVLKGWLWHQMTYKVSYAIKQTNIRT